MKQTQKGKKKGANQKQAQNQEEPFSGFQLAMGEMDLIFTINFTDKDLEKPDGEGDDKYYKIEDMSSIKDLSFLKDKDEEFISRIKMRPNSEFTKQLLLGNKISKKKCFIDFITFGRPKFEGDEEFFDTIFNQVTVKDRLQINSTPLEEGRFSLVIELKHKDKEQKIQLGTTPSEKEAEEKEEEKKKKEEEEEQRKQKEEQEKQEMEEKKQKKIEEYKKKREEEKKKKEEEEQRKKEGGTPNEENQENNQQEEQNNEEKNENNNEEEKKEENNEENKEEENKEEKNEEEEEEDYEPNEAMKEKKIPKFKRQKSVLCNLKPSMTKYDLFFFNHDDIKKIPGDFKMKDLYELLEFFKKKKTNIFINYYQNESPEEENKENESKEKEGNKKEEPKSPEEEEKKKAEEEKKKKAEEEKKQKAEEEKKKEDERKQKEKRLVDIDKERTNLNNRKKDLNDNKKKEVKEMKDEDKKNELNEIDEKLNQLGEEEQDILDEFRAEEEVKKEYNKKKEKERKKEEKEKEEQEKKEMAELNYLFYLTDGYFFDTKQACKLFTRHYLVYTTEKDKEKKKINKQKVYDYFITCISRGTAEEVPGSKVGLFMEDFNKYVIIYATQKAADKKEFNAQPHPKINPHNTDLIGQYKEILKKNKNDYYSILASLAAQQICINHGISTEIIYPSFLTALEIIKRKVECEKNGITSINEDQLYKVKINEKALQQELEKLATGNKEGGFVLDCTNKSKSSLKDYVALYDYHLRGFFSSELTRKNLKEKGFIDSKGFIMYDPVYRSVMGAQCKNKKKYEGEELKSKIISSIKGIDVPARLKDKELEARKMVENQQVPIKKQIPYVKDSNQYKQTKKKKKKKKEDGRSSSDGNSSDEGKSGDANNSESANEGNSSAQ